MTNRSGDRIEATERLLEGRLTRRAFRQRRGLIAQLVGITAAAAETRAVGAGGAAGGTNRHAAFYARSEDGQIGIGIRDSGCRDSGFGPDWGSEIRDRDRKLATGNWQLATGD